MKKNSKSIFGKLIASYIIFAAVSIIGLLAFFVIAVFQTVDETSMEGEYPFVSFTEDGKIAEPKNLADIGGWAEVLNDENEVVEVLGEAKQEHTKYTYDEILDLLSMTMEFYAKGDYYNYYHNQGDYRYMIYYPKDQFAIVYNIDAGDMVYTSFNKSILFGLLAFLVLEVLGVSLFISRRITKPMAALSSGMERVAAGEENVEIPIYKEKEFAEIQSAFQNMTLQLQQQKAEKEELIQRRHQMLLELSHDIKTPVATIKSYAFALSEQMVPEEERVKYYDTIARKADRVNQLTVDLFTLLKMESEGYQVEAEKINFSELVRTVLANLYEEITGAGFELEIEMPDEDFYVNGDERYLTRVVENLLNNAKKYNKTGHLIQVELEQKQGDAKQISLKVWDDGEEIEKDVQETMFLPFVRGEKSRKSDGGTGLGLAITKQIVEKHQGSLTYCYEKNLNCFDVVLNRDGN